MFSRILSGPVAVAALLAVVLSIDPPREVQAAPPVSVAVVADGAHADLAMVPADAVGFVHVRLADLWKNDLMAALRKTFERAGEKALATLDTQFSPAPSSIDTITGFVLMDDPMKEPNAYGIVAFSKPFVAADVVKSYLPKAERMAAGDRIIYTDAAKGIEVSFPDDRHILVGEAGSLSTYFAHKPVKNGPIAKAIKLAETRPVVAAANIAGLPIPPEALNQIPENIRPILKADQLVISLDLGDQARVDVRATYKDEAAGAAAETAVRALVDLGRQQLGVLKKQMEDKFYAPKPAPRPAEELPEAIGTVFTLGALGRVDDVLADPKLITRDGAELVFSAAMPKELAVLGGGTAAIALPAIQKVRAAASRSQSQNNLKQIALAIHNYEAANGHLPTDITDKNGKAILSWRVAILPYIEQANIYQSLKLDEPWDSPANSKFTKMKIKTFISPNSAEVEDKNGFGLTNYLAIKGKGAAFESGKKLRFVDITDGTSNTIMVLDNASMVPWAKPDDLPFDETKPLPKLDSSGTPGLCLAAMMDGSVRTINLKTVKPETLKAAMTRAGGEVLGADW
jgi:type II secretory pathway pseudopilin PulG